MIKPFLGEATIAKLRIFGHDPKAWKSALLEEIDADQLPAHYGGSQRDPDGNPMCLTKVIVFIFQYFIFFVNDCICICFRLVKISIGGARFTKEFKQNIST